MGISTEDNSKNNSLGLILTGGGARGAYQAGVLKGVSQVLTKDQQGLPFRVLSGSSAGAINCAYLACGNETFSNTCLALSHMWENIGFSDIYKTDASSLSRLGFRWAKGLSFAGLGSTSAPNHLLDTSPLQRLIKEKINFRYLPEFERHGGILAINTTHYQTGAAITFYSDTDEAEDWLRSLRLSVRTKIEPIHVMASSAIPILFPPIKIGKTFYGDGALRMKAPFSPAIHLGATKIFAIGVRKPKSMEEMISITEYEMKQIHLSDIAGVILNSVFLDSLDADLERLQRINKTLSIVKDEESEATPLKPIDVLAIQPSEDLGQMAKPTLKHFPKTIRYLLSGIGADGERGSDLLSYLSFHPTYTHALISLGYKDALKKKEEIRSFFLEGD